jgi:hypothetical protein
VKLPNAVERLRRQRLRVAAVLLLASLSIAAANVGETAQVHLLGAVDANWRGAYDILVRASGSRLDIESTNGFVEPNFLSFAGSGGIDLRTLTAIRSVQGVDLAAPISVVGYLTYTLSAPILYRTDAPKRTTLYRIDLNVSTSDGLSDIRLQRQTGRWLISPGGFQSIDTAPRSVSDVGDTSTAAGGPGGTGFVQLTFAGFLPSIASPLIAVDPTAEAALLGPTASFLSPLKDSEATGLASVGAFDKDRIPDAYGVLRDQLANATGGALDRPVVPILASRRLYAPLRLEVDIDQVGAPIGSFPTDEHVGQALVAAESAAGPGTTPIGRSVVDATQGLRPFVPPYLVVGWPGSGPVNGQPYRLLTPSLQTLRLMQRPEYRAIPPPADDADPVFSIGWRGFVDSEGQVSGGPASPPPGVPAGGFSSSVESSYRSFIERPIEAARSFRPSDPYDQPFFLAPIGDFDLGSLDLPTNTLSYVPMGAYDPVETELVRNVAGVPLPQPRTMTPTLNPAGLIAVPPLAITNLVGAELLRGQAPIDAVRVRVAGIAGYGPAGRAKVEEVASRIARLGLDVDIVAGSSPQPVEVFVPSYDVHAQPPADLGYVRQGWTTLGAADRVERGVGSVNEALLALALMAGIVFVSSIEVISLTSRAGEVAILRAVGWTRREVRAWIVGEAAVAALVVMSAGLVVWVFSRRGLAALVIVCALSTSLIVAAFIAEIGAWGLAMPGTPPRSGLWVRIPRTGAFAVHGVRSYAFRTLTIQPVRTGVTIAALGFGTAVVTCGLAALVSSGDRAGPTLLADAVTGALQGEQVLLLFITGSMLVVLGILLVRHDLRRRAPEFVALRAIGWGPARVSSMLRAERTLTGLAAAAFAALSTVGLGRVLEIGVTTTGYALAVGLAVASALLAGIRGPRSA